MNGGSKVPVSNFFIRRILDRIRLLDQYDEDDIDMMRYSLQAILWEIEKLIIIFLLFSLIGRHAYFLITLMALISIRVVAGGYHSQTPINCLLVTLFGFFLAIVVLPLINLN
jgi:Accessory gene regulator B.